MVRLPRVRMLGPERDPRNRPLRQACAGQVRTFVALLDKIVEVAVSCTQDERRDLVHGIDQDGTVRIP